MIRCSLCRGAGVILGAVSMEDRERGVISKTIQCPMCLAVGWVVERVSTRDAIVIGGVVCRAGMLDGQAVPVGEIVGEVTEGVRDRVASIRRKCGLDTVRACDELIQYMQSLV